MEDEIKGSTGETGPEGSKTDNSKETVDETKTEAQTQKSEDNATQVSKPEDNTTPKKELTVTDLFIMSKELTKRMHNTHGEISQIKKSSTRLKARKKEIQKAIKSNGRIMNKISVLGKKKSILSEEDRVILKAEKEWIKNELILLNEQKWIKMKELKTMAGSTMKASKRDQNMNKSMSNSYIARNRWSIEGKLLATLNEVILGNNKEYQDLLLSLQKGSLTITEENIKKFNEKLAEFLDEVDPETFILCSHNLKGPLYKAITLTLQEWPGEGEIEKLIFPPEEQDSDSSGK